MKRETKRLAAALGASLALHGAAAEGIREYYSPRAGVRGTAATLAGKYDKLRAQHDRKALVEEARFAAKAGTLKLGEFFLRANRIDAREKGEKFDFAKAKEIYEKHLAKVGSELKSGSSIMDALHESLDHLDYHGVGGGKMGDLLLEGGGSCEPHSHNIASLLYDLGFRKEVHFRHYGGRVPHLAPIFVYEDKGEKEFDLLAGKEARRKGVRFPASTAIELYAAGHGLPAEVPAGKSEGRIARRFPGPSLGTDFKYPDNSDEYPGSVPLFKRGAIGWGGESGGVVGMPGGYYANSPEHIFEKMIGYDAPTEKLIPIDYDRFSKSGRERAVEGGAEEIEKARQILNSGVSKGEQLVWLTYLPYAYDHVEAGLRTIGKNKLADLTLKEREKTVNEAKSLLDEIDVEKDFKKMSSEAKSFLGMIALFNQKGAATVLELVEKGAPLDKFNLLALIRSPNTRKKAYELFDKLPGAQQHHLVAYSFEPGSGRLEIIVPWLREHGETGFLRAIDAFNGCVKFVPPFYRRAADEESFNAGKFTLGPNSLGEFIESLHAVYAKHGVKKEFAETNEVNRVGNVLPALVANTEFHNFPKGKDSPEMLQFLKDFLKWTKEIDLEKKREPNKDFDRALKRAKYIISQGRFDRETVAKAIEKYSSIVIIPTGPGVGEPRRPPAKMNPSNKRQAIAAFQRRRRGRR